MTYFLLCAGIVFTICCSFFFSLSETALLSLNRYRLRFLLEKKGQKIQFLQEIFDKPEKILTPILVGNTLANVIAATLTSFLIARLFADKVIGIGDEIAQFAGSLLVVVILLIFGEITPKAIAARYPESFALKVLFPLHVVMLVLSPLVAITLTASRGLIRLLTRKRAAPRLQALTVDELRSIITHHGNSAFSAEALEMIHKMFEFPSISVRDVMVPRNRVVMLRNGSGMQDVLRIYQKYDFSNIPVYDSTPDNILGVIPRREFYREAVRHFPDAREFPIQGLVRPAVFVPETTSIADLLKQFQRSHNHCAVVVDELGQFEGIVTLEDVLEEIVGEILASHDEGREPILRIGPGHYLINGMVSIREFNRFFPYPLPLTETYSTLAGFLMNLQGKLPGLHETISWEKYVFAIEEVAGHQIRTVRLSSGEPSVPGATAPPASQ